MMKCLYFYFVYHEDELGSSFAFIPAIFLRSIGVCIIKTYPGFLHRGVTLLRIYNPGIKGCRGGINLARMF